MGTQIEQPVLIIRVTVGESVQTSLVVFTELQAIPMGVEDNTDVSTTSHHKHIIYILLGQILNFIRATTSNRVDGHNKQGNPVFAKLADLT